MLDRSNLERASGRDDFALFCGVTTGAFSLFVVAANDSCTSCEMRITKEQLQKEVRIACATSMYEIKDENELCRMVIDNHWRDARSVGIAYAARTFSDRNGYGGADYQIVWMR